MAAFIPYHTHTAMPLSSELASDPFTAGKLLAIEARPLSKMRSLHAHHGNHVAPAHYKDPRFSSGGRRTLVASLLPTISFLGPPHFAWTWPTIS